MSTAQKQLILIVDDDHGMRRAMSRLLSAAGYAICAFGSTEDATASNEIGHAHCMVIDVHLAGSFGTAWYAAMNAQRPPAVFVTAFDSVEVRAATQLAGARGFLTKPFAGQVLIDAVRAAMHAPTGN